MYLNISLSNLSLNYMLEVLGLSLLSPFSGISVISIDLKTDSIVSFFMTFVPQNIFDRKRFAMFGFLLKF